jgi:two-component system response regulator AtoC
MPLTLPPLRDRDGDLRLLVEHYVDRFNREFRKKVRGVNGEAMALLEQYRWPGNIRELRNAIERAMLLVDHDWLVPRDLPSLTRHAFSNWLFRLPPEGVNLDAVGRQLLVQALERSAWNQTQAGHLLRINRDQVRYRIEKFGLRPHDGHRQPPQETAAAG